MVLYGYDVIHNVMGRKDVKIKLEVSKDIYDELKGKLENSGFLIDDDADFVLSQRNAYIDYLAVRKDDVSVHIPVDQIVYIESLGHDVFVYTGTEKYKSLERLWQLEKKLNPNCFLRISKSTIIATKQVKKIRPALSQKFLLTLSCGALVDVTRTYYYAFREYFGI